MPRIRDDIFLATKTGDRDREGAWASINRSLERLQTDRVDLLQLHAVGDLDELGKALGKGGAIEAAVRAKDEGLVGDIGITGHGDQAPRHAPGGAAPLPVRDRADAAQPRAVARPGLPRRLRGARGRGPPAGRRADDDQDGVAAQLARRAPADALDLVRAVHRRRADPRHRLVGARRTTRSPAWRRRATSGCCSTSSPPSATGSRPADAEAVLDGDAEYSSPFMHMTI